jgi:hypothetical protein
MKKTLLMAAAALAAGIITSQAQPVYSQNIVGYVNTTLPVGYSLITVPLNAAASGNTVPATNVLNALQSSDAVIIWNGSGYSTYTYVAFGPGQAWLYPDGSFSDVSPNLSIGQGFFYQNGQGAPETNTFTGTVVTTNQQSLVVGYSLVASSAPVGGLLDSTNFSLPFQSGDAVIIWNGSGYSTYTYFAAGPGQTWQYPNGSFSDIAPSINAAQGFFYQNGQGAAEIWTQNLIVQ